MLGKVLLVDDHTLFIEGLKYMLETYGISVVGVAKNGLEAITKAKIHEPDIILMDIRMPKCDGITALERIKNELPQTKVIMLTTAEEDESLFEAIKCGASGYLLKNLNAEELVHMLKELQEGEVPLSRGLARRLLNEFQNKEYMMNMRNRRINNEKCSARVVEETVLTERQIEVLKLVSKGKTYCQVGDALGITERTIKYHMARIIEKLQLENKAQAIVYASKLGLLGSKKNKK